MLSSDDIKRIVKRQEKCRQNRTTWETHWQDVADFVIPRYGDITSTTEPGSKRTQYMYDSTAPLALDSLAAGLVSLMTNPALPWFDFKIPIPELMADHDVKIYLENCVKIVIEALADSNFYLEIHETYIQLGSLATSPLYCEEGEDTDLNFKSVHVKEVDITEDSGGNVNGLFRKFDYTASQAIEEFGIEAFQKIRHPEIIKDAEKDPDKKYPFMHYTYKRKGYDPRPEYQVNPLKRPWADVYIDMTKKELLYEGGFYEQPAACPRWTKKSGDKFGESPAMKVLPEIMMLNEMRKMSIEAGQKELDPPIQVPAEGYRLPLRTGTGGVNYYDPESTDGNKAEALFVGGTPRYSLEDIRESREKIKEAFFVDLLLRFSRQSPAKTATEILEMADEVLRQMGPLLGRMQPELLKVVINRAWGILKRAGKLPEQPEAMLQYEGAPIQVEYINPIAIAQKVAKAQGIGRALNFLSPLIEIYPEIPDKYDPDEIVDTVNDLFGVPKNVQRPDYDVRQIREGRAAQQAEQAKIGQAADMLSLMGQASEVDPGGGMLPEIVSGAGGEQKLLPAPG